MNAIAKITDSDRLSSLLAGQRAACEDRRMVPSRTTSGNVTINGTIMHIAQDDLPFGGVGPSGMGAYHGIEGFRTLSHAKGIYEQGRWNLSNLLRVPFRQPIDTILNMMLR